MWLCSSLLIWAMVPNIYFVHALAVGACVTPTDPILSNSIVKGSFAEENVPQDLRHAIVAESGANDGLGYPFLFIGLFLVQYVGDGTTNQSEGVKAAIGKWFEEAWAYQIFLGAAYGAVVGWLAKQVVNRAWNKKLVSHESLIMSPVIIAVSLHGPS